NSDIYSLAVSENTIFAGGRFTIIGGQVRNKLAALDGSSGSATAWNPSPTGPPSMLVDLLVVSDDGKTIYVGGGFTSIGGEYRNGLAAVDTSIGNPTPWNPNPNGGVLSLAVNGSTIYAGGSFISIGGQARNNLAALDASMGDATPWNPNANGQVL